MPGNDEFPVDIVFTSEVALHANIVTPCPTCTLASPLECASMRHAPVSISFSTRDLLSFFSFRAHLLGGGRRPPERTRLNSAVRPRVGRISNRADRRLRWPGSRSRIYTSTVAHEDGFALPPLRL